MKYKGVTMSGNPNTSGGVVPNMPEKKKYGIPGWPGYTQAPKVEGFKHPNNCYLCGKAIVEGYYYHFGIDDNEIHAITCINFDCKKWLKYSRRIQKTGVYLKEEV